MTSDNCHDIFLSHSGAQKGFAKDLYRVLTGHGFSTFFDITLHSLPLAAPFPKRIFDAASSCKLALVVLSTDYLSSKWPMYELCVFARAIRSSVKILPLFLHLVPEDLKNDQNLERWREAWSCFAESDPQHRINVEEWEKALRSLRSLNGLVRDVKAEGELGFIERIVSSILVSYPELTLRNRYDTSYVQGEARLRQIILDKFREMESSSRHREQHAHQNTVSCVLGIHGIPGSGKSTLCRGLANYFWRLYAGKSLHVELPSNPTPSTLLHALKGFLSLLTLHIETERVTHIDQLISVIKSHGRSSWNTVFLAVDNISEDSISAVFRILPYVIGLGSKVVLVARTREVLRPIILRFLAQNCACDYLAMPSVSETEAMDILLQTVMGQGSTDAALVRGPADAILRRGETELDDYMVAKYQKVMQVVRMCGFGPNLMYSPVVMQRMGVALINRLNDDDVHEWIHDQEMFWKSFNVQDVRVSRKHVVTQLILNSFETLLDEELQLLFMDVVLFSGKFKDEFPLVQACTSVLEKAYSILGAMHGRDVAEIQEKVRHLQRLCFIQRATNDDGFVVHDLYREFASSLYESRFYGAYGVYDFTDEQNIYLDEKMINRDKTRRPLRGMVLHLGVKCKELVLKNFPDLKALVVTGYCVNFATFRMAGLTSLATLDVIGFGRKFPLIICSDASLQNVRRLNLACLALYFDKMNNTPEWRRQVFSQESPEGMSSGAWGLISAWIPAAWRRWSRGPDIGIAMHMRCLRILILRGTGIKKLEDMGSCWPHLQDLQVHECLLTELRPGALPALTTLVFKDCMHHYHHKTSYDYSMDVRSAELAALARAYRRELSERKRKRNCVHISNYMLEGEGFLEGCPRLQEVRITSAFFRNAYLMNPSSKYLRVLELVCVDAMQQLPDLSSCAETLQILTLVSCNDLKRVDFLALAGFVSLVEVTIARCDSLEEINLTGLPCLRRLVVCHLKSIRVLSGLDNINLVQLQFLRLGSLGDQYSGRLIERCLSFVNSLQQDQRQLLQHLKLQYFPVTLSTSFSVTSSLRNLVTLELEFLPQVTHIYGVDSLIHLERLALQVCKSLEELPSLHALQRLNRLDLSDCVKLRAVQGCDEMRALEVAVFRGCESLEEPPFHDLSLIQRSHPRLWLLQFEECKFACTTYSKSRELMVKWARELESKVVLQALLWQLLWEYYQADQVPINKEKVVEEVFLPCLLNLLPYDEHNCINFEEVPWTVLRDCRYVDVEKMTRFLEHSNEFGRGKRKEVLFQQLNLLTPIFCGILDACQGQSYKKRLIQKSYYANL